MIVVLVVLGSRLRIEEVVSRDEFEGLFRRAKVKNKRRKIKSASRSQLFFSHVRESLFLGAMNEEKERSVSKLTRQAALQLSTVGPHDVPKMISGQRYCLV